MVPKSFSTYGILTESVLSKHMRDVWLGTEIQIQLLGLLSLPELIGLNLIQDVWVVYCQPLGNQGKRDLKSQVSCATPVGAQRPCLSNDSLCFLR